MIEPLQISMNEMRFYLLGACRAIDIAPGQGDALFEAAIYLARLEIDPLTLILPALQHYGQHRCDARFALNKNGRTWRITRPGDLPISAIWLGPAIGDILGPNVQPDVIEIDAIDVPGLVLAYAQQAANKFDKGARSGSSNAKSCPPTHSNLDDSEQAISLEHFQCRTAGLAIELTGSSLSAGALCSLKSLAHSGIQISRQNWHALLAIFNASLVPSNVQSHTLGAGAGADSAD